MIISSVVRQALRVPPNHCGAVYGRVIATAEQQVSQTHASLTNTEQSVTTLPSPPPYLTCYLDLHKAQDSYNGLIWAQHQLP